MFRLPWTLLFVYGKYANRHLCEECKSYFVHEKYAIIFVWLSICVSLLISDCYIPSNIIIFYLFLFCWLISTNFSFIILYLFVYVITSWISVSLLMFTCLSIYPSENYLFNCQCEKCTSQLDDPDITSEEEECDSSMDNDDWSDGTFWISLYECWAQCPPSSLPACWSLATLDYMASCHRVNVLSVPSSIISGPVCSKAHMKAFDLKLQSGACHP